MKAALALLVLFAPLVLAEEGDVLKPGAPAPKLAVAEWVKGGAVGSFEEGKVYVVEFWATWCGPCIAGIPHLTRMQAKHRDAGLTLISVTSEDPNNTLENVRALVTERGDGMGYTVAWDEGRTTYAAWMEAAKQRGIPTSFVVDKQGRIAYIGHPITLDIPVKRCLDGTWDAESGPAEVEQLFKEAGEASQAGQSSPTKALEMFAAIEKKAPEVAGVFDSTRFALLLQAEKYDAASALGNTITEEAISCRDAMALNEVAWSIVDPEAFWTKRDLALARKAAVKAVEFTKSEDAAILDTLARVHFLEGDAKKALELQKKAVAIATRSGDANAWASLQGALQEYEEAVAAEAAGG